MAGNLTDILQPVHEMERKISEAKAPPTLEEMRKTLGEIKNKLHKEFEGNKDKLNKIDDILYKLEIKWHDAITKLATNKALDAEVIQFKTKSSLYELQLELGQEIDDPNMKKIYEAQRWASDYMATNKIEDYEEDDEDNENEKSSRAEGMLHYYMATVKVNSDPKQNLAGKIYGTAYRAYKREEEQSAFYKIWEDVRLDFEDLKKEFNWEQDEGEIGALNIKLSAHSLAVILGLFKCIDENNALSEQQKIGKRGEIIEKLKILQYQLEQFPVKNWQEQYDDAKEYQQGRQQADFLLKKLTETLHIAPGGATAPEAGTPPTKTGESKTSPQETPPTQPDTKEAAKEKKQEDLDAFKFYAQQIEKAGNFKFQNSLIGEMLDKTALVNGDGEKLAEAEQKAKEEVTAYLAARREDLKKRTDALMAKVTTLEEKSQTSLKPDEQTQWAQVSGKIKAFPELVQAATTAPGEQELLVNFMIKKLATDNLGEQLHDLEKDLKPFESYLEGAKAEATGEAAGTSQPPKIETPSGGSTESESGATAPSGSASEDNETVDDPYLANWPNAKEVESPYQGKTVELVLNPRYRDKQPLRNDDGKVVKWLEGGDLVKTVADAKAKKVPGGKADNLYLTFIQVEHVRDGGKYWVPKEALKEPDGKIPGQEPSVPEEDRETQKPKTAPEVPPELREYLSSVNTEYLPALKAIASDLERVGGTDFTLPRFKTKFHASKEGDEQYVVSWNSPDGRKGKLLYHSVQSLMENINRGELSQTLVYLQVNSRSFYEKYKEDKNGKEWIGRVMQGLPETIDMYNLDPSKTTSFELDWRGAYPGKGNAWVNVTVLPHGLISFTIQRRNIGTDGKSNKRQCYAATFKEMINQIYYARYDAENYDDDLKPEQLKVVNERKKLLNDLRNPSIYYYSFYKDKDGRPFQVGRPLAFETPNYNTAKVVLDWNNNGKIAGNALVKLRVGDDNMIYYSINYPDGSFRQAEKRVGSFYELMANLDEATLKGVQQRKVKNEKKDDSGKIKPGTDAEKAPTLRERLKRRREELRKKYDKGK